MSIRKTIFMSLILSLPLFINSTKGQSIAVSAMFDSNQILSGDQIYYTIEVVKSPSIQIQLPTLADTLVKEIEIISTLKNDTSQNKDNQTVIRQKYLITSFDSGAFNAPAIAIPFMYDNKWDTIYSNVAQLTVNFLPAQPNDTIKDIKTVYKMPFSPKEIKWWWYVIALVIVASVLGFLIWNDYRIKKEKALLPKIKEPAHIIALRALDTLKEEKLWQQDKTKQYYSQLSDITRTYFENRFGFNAMEQVTSETLDDFKNTSFATTELSEGLKDLLTNADFVKFAKANPMPEENERRLTFVYNLISQTKEIEVIATDEAVNKKGVGNE